MKNLVKNFVLRANVLLGSILFCVMDAAVGAGQSSQQLLNRMGGSTSADVGETIAALNYQIADLPYLLLSVGQAAGIYFALTGGNDIRKAGEERNQGQGLGAKGAVKIVGGIFAYFLPSVLGMGGKTFFPTL